ncbi:MAG: Rieske 2Fe-2S domain-containing protein [Chloroflexi bacterium]|nr:Rieske 2Fe-2S domain-containing protein [Chloroflexota bacterium]
MEYGNAADLYHTGPGTLAGEYMRKFWQPVHRAKDLQRGQALGIRIMSEDFTLFRGDRGTPRLVGSRCAHRGTQLSIGWVEGDSIRCRYHGWRYNGEGQCVEQPLEERPAPERVCIRSYQVEEYLGLIFAYLGAEPAPPLRRFPDFDRPGYVEAGPPEYWPCNYMTRIDNDPRHVVFTHRESWKRMGDPVRPAGTRLLAEETEYGVRTYGEPVPGRPQRYTYFHMPNINQVRSPRIEGTLDDSRNLEADRLFWRVPIDDERCVNFVVDYIPLKPEEAEEYGRRREAAGEAKPAELNALGDAILAGRMRLEDLPADMSIYKLFWIEDYITQVGQGAPAGRPPEHLGSADMGVVLKRKIWERELRALANGEPLKQWYTPAGLAEAQGARVPIG